MSDDHHNDYLFWAAASQKVLDTVWDNSQDDVYHEVDVMTEHLPPMMLSWYNGKELVSRSPSIPHGYSNDMRWSIAIQNEVCADGCEQTYYSYHSLDEHGKHVDDGYSFTSVVLYE